MYQLEEIREMLPSKCIAQCSAPGDNYDACAYWTRLLQLNLSRQACIGILEPFGWCDRELENQDKFELNVKVLWIAAGET